MSEIRPCDHDMSISWEVEQGGWCCLECGARINVTVVEVDQPPDYGDFASALVALDQLARALDTIPAGVWVTRTLLDPYRRTLDVIRHQVEWHQARAVRNEEIRPRRWLVEGSAERSTNADGE